jgi:succinoglycan biosynthesis transport protein ExoP
LLEMLTCRAVLSKVVDELGADVILAPPEHEGLYYKAKQHVRDLRQQLKKFYATESDVAPSRDETAIEALAKRVVATAPKSSSVITVAAESHSPELAQTFAATLVDVYMREHMKLNSTAGSEGFFRHQKKLVADQLFDAKTKLSELRSEMGIGSAETEYERLEEEKAQIESLRNLLAREVAGSAAKCEALEAEVDVTDEVVLAARAEGVANEATDGMRQQLYELEIAEDRASRRFTENHPSLKVIRGQLDSMRAVFTSQDSDRTQSTFARNSGRERLELELQQERTKLAEIEAEKVAADLQGDEVLAALAQLNDRSRQLDRLIQDVAFLEQSFVTYSESLEQARIGTSLTEQQITNVNIAQPATYVSNPVSPNRTLLAGTGLLLAIIGAIALALVVENLDRSFKSADEIEEFTDLPVLISLAQESRPVLMLETVGSRRDVS